MRRVLAVVALVVALVAGACGNGDGDGAASGDLPLLPSSGGGAGGDAESASGAGGARSAATAMAAEGDDAAASDMAIAPMEPYQPVEYRLADDIEKMGGKAPAYRLEATVDEGTVRRLADAFGVKGTAKEENGSWNITDPASRARGLYVSPDGTFNFYDESAAMRAEASAVCSSDGKCEDTTPAEPALPSNLPSESEARKAAEEAFDKAGVDLGDREARIDRSDYNVAVSYSTSLDGTEVEGWGFVASFGDNAQLQYVSGSLANPSEIGQYPLVETKAAYDRWSAGMGGGGRVGIATDTAVAEPAVGAPASGGGTDAVAPETVPTLPPKIVEIDRVEQVLLVEYGRCPGDPMYLVPGYRLYAGDDVYASIPAVADEYLAASQDAPDPAGDRATSSGDSFEPCPNTGVGETEPGREPDSPTVTIE
jgi:hypothetical protein